jgi:hypothetical protein
MEIVVLVILGTVIYIAARNEGARQARCELTCESLNTEYQKHREDTCFCKDLEKPILSLGTK